MTVTRSLRSVLAACGALAAIGLTASPAGSSPRPTTIDRIVAVVGDQPIVLSELRERARPILAQSKPSPGTSPEQARRRVYEALIDLLIDERIIAREAAARGIDVSARDVDRAMQQVVQQNQITLAELLAGLEAQGMSESFYRQELARHLREAKLLMVLFRDQVTGLKGAQLSERLAELRKAWLHEQRERTYIELRTSFK